MTLIRFKYDGRRYEWDTEKELKNIFFEKYIRGSEPVTVAVGKEYAKHIKHFEGSFDRTEEIEFVNKIVRLFNEQDPGYAELLKIFHAYRVFRIYILDDAAKKQMFDIALKDLNPKNVKKHIDILNAMKYLSVGNTDEMIPYMNLAEQRPEFLPVLTARLNNLSVWDFEQLEKNLDKYYKNYPKNVAPVIREWYQLHEQLKQLNNKTAEYKEAQKKLLDKFKENVAQRAASNKLNQDR